MTSSIQYVNDILKMEELSSSGFALREKYVEELSDRHNLFSERQSSFDAFITIVIEGRKISNKFYKCCLVERPTTFYFFYFIEVGVSQGKLKADSCIVLVNLKETVEYVKLEKT